MANFTAYVNASSSGGDGTTNNESGATAAFASLSAAESAMQATAIGAGETGIIYCSSGSLNNVDPTVVEFAGWTINATGALRIEGHPSSGTGRYTGDAAFSSNHYRLVTTANASSLLISTNNTTVNGIQVHLDHSNGFRTGIQPGSVTNCVVENNRVRANAATTQYGIGQPNSAIGINSTHTIRNNLVVNVMHGISIISTAHFGGFVANVINNTVYGIGASGNGIAVDLNWASGTPTLNLRNNAVANCGTDITVVDAGSSTVNRTNNRTEDATAPDSSIGVTTDAWTNPGTATTSDFTVKNTSSSLYNSGTATGAPSTDIRGQTRDATIDVGAYELVAAGPASFPYTGVGGIQFAGVGTIQKSKLYTMSGGIVYSGIAGIVKSLSETGTGGVIFGGSAATEGPSAVPGGTHDIYTRIRRRQR